MKEIKERPKLFSDRCLETRICCFSKRRAWSKVSKAFRGFTKIIPVFIFLFMPIHNKVYQLNQARY